MTPQKLAEYPLPENFVNGFPKISQVTLTVDAASYTQFIVLELFYLTIFTNSI